MCGLNQSFDSKCWKISNNYNNAGSDNVSPNDLDKLSWLFLYLTKRNHGWICDDQWRVSYDLETALPTFIMIIVDDFQRFEKCIWINRYLGFNWWFAFKETRTIWLSRAEASKQHLSPVNKVVTNSDTAGW